MIGVVLAGGRSSRLGRDKTRLHLHGRTRPPKLIHTLSLLREVCTDVAISCRVPFDPATFPPFAANLDSIPQIPDHVPDQGPLGGILSCLHALGGPLLVLSCDLPCMDLPTLRRLCAARDAAPADTLMTTWQQTETGYIEALVAIYEAASLPFFSRALASGIRRLNLVIPPERRCCLPYSHAEKRPFFNVNYPEDLQILHAPDRP